MTTTVERPVSSSRAPSRAPRARPRFLVPVVPATGLALVAAGWLTIALGAPSPTGVLATIVVAGVAALRLTLPGRARAWVALAAGTPGLVVGTGIGGRWLQKAPLTPEAFGGAASLAGGLLLVGWAGAVLVRTARGWRRLGALPVALAVAIVVWTAFPALVASVVPPTTLGGRTPAAYGLAFSDVAFRTADGARISAWWVPGTNGAAVIVRHGSGSTRTSTLAHAAVLARHGYGVLLTDARGHGRSGGDGMDWGWFGDSDVTAAVAYLTDVAGVARVAVLGLSMGGEEAIGAAAADPRIDAVVAEGVTARTAADRDRILPRSPNGWLQRGLDRVTFGLAGLLTDAPRPQPLRESAASSGVPTLLVAAGAVADEIEAARAIRDAAPDSVDVWVVPGAGHTGGLATAPAGWESHVTAFLDSTLLSEEARR
jgi:pimeloyl-ACP methyl ester carboxylesterase